jgi:probable phosphoglycerate mutase
MRTRLCLVRHGETAWNAEHRVQGQLDAPLNGVGLAQAQAVARALAGEAFAAVYSSDLQRARVTAEATAGPRGQAVREEAALRERHYGIFQSLTYAEVKQRYPEDYARFERREPDYDFRTGESLRAFSARSIAAITRIAEEHRGTSVLVFTHGGVLDKLDRFVTGMPLSAPRDFAIPNCGINRIETDGAGWRIVAWASDSHLEDALDDLPE